MAWLIVIIPALILQLVCMLITASFPAYGLRRVWKAENSQQRAAWLLFALVPLFALVAINLWVTYDIDRRERELAALETINIKNQQFDRVVSVGGLRSREPIDLLTIAGAKELFDFDVRLDELKKKGATPIIYKLKQTPECNTHFRSSEQYQGYVTELRATGLTESEERTPGGSVFKELYYSYYSDRENIEYSNSEGDIENCLMQTKGNRVSWSDVSTGSLIYLSGHETSLRESNVLRGAIHELRLARNNDLVLVAYSETRLGHLESKVKCLINLFFCASAVNSYRALSPETELNDLLTTVFKQAPPNHFKYDRLYEYHNKRAEQRYRGHFDGDACSVVEQLSAACTTSLILRRKECSSLNDFNASKSCFASTGL
jgi:hypothetical protein